MQESAQKQIQAFPGKSQLATFAGRLLEWLNHDLNPRGEPLAESRARALLLAANVLDEPTRHSFAQAVESEQGMRLALYNLLRESGLSENDECAALAMAAAVAPGTDQVSTPSWLALSVAAFAWRSGFLLDHLDPASPPTPYSPAGQVLKRTAHFMRQEIQRSATERDKLSRKLAHATSSTSSLDTLHPDAPVAPLPPYYRSPVPETYPEYNPAIEVAPDELAHHTTPMRQEPISITSDDLAPAEPARPSPPVTQPSLRVDISPAESSAQSASRSLTSSHANVVMPGAAVAARSGSGSRKRDRGKLKSTKLQIVVQERPDGPGLYGLQVKVSSRNTRRYVAGTTNQDGEFTCELPVPVDSGLTYDVDVTWPRDYGNDIERKSITLNADRTHFTLPFYRTLKG